VGFSAGLSERHAAAAAVREACERALSGLGEGPPPDVALAFFSPHHLGEAEAIAAAVAERTGAAAVAGCSGEGVIGEHECEGKPALSVLAGRLPGARVRTHHVTQEEIAAAVPGGEDEAERGELPAEGWWTAVGTALGPGERRVLIVLADPFSVDVEELLRQVNAGLPGVPAIGGLASAGFMPGQNRVLKDAEVVGEGAVVVSIEGRFGFEALVSQGCRPIGRHLVITRAQGNVIASIGGRPALEAIRDIITHLPPDEQRRCQRALHVGRVIDEAKERFGRGDFLIRNLVGADPESGAIAIADHVRTGQTIQLHVRDAEAATEDLKHLLADRTGNVGGEGPASAGMLLFSCNGRGRRLFKVPDHDVSLLRGALGAVPVAGFFCGGEVGPIGGRNFLHGYTSSVGIFTAAHPAG